MSNNTSFHTILRAPGTFFWSNMQNNIFLKIVVNTVADEGLTN